MFINNFDFNFLSFLGQPKKVRVSRKKINIEFFVDLDEDIAGWYALGHHDPKEFLAIVVRQNPGIKLSCDEVKLIWAKFEHEDFLASIEKPTDSILPITFLAA
jgi:hypothetical protein